MFAFWVQGIIPDVKPEPQDVIVLDTREVEQGERDSVSEEEEDVVQVKIKRDKNEQVSKKVSADFSVLVCVPTSPFCCL